MSSLDPKDRSRSPRFPSQSLEDSLRHIRSIYDGVHRSPIDSETAFRLMGFSGKTGTSAKALGSLRQYGLIEGMGDRTRVSDLALSILEPESASERVKSIKFASRNPDVFGSIVSRFENHIPQADEPIRAFLIRELGFQKNSADECIRTLRQTILFSESQGDVSATVASEVISPEPEEPENGSETNNRGQGRALTSEQPTQLASIPLSRECRAELQIYGPLTGKAVANLIRHIELLSEVWDES